MSGSGVVPGGWAPGDWLLLDVTGGPHHFSDFTLDGGGRRDTGEQTHLLMVSGPARGVVIQDMEVKLPKLVQPAGAVGCIPAETDVDYATRQCHWPPSGTALCRTLGTGARCLPAVSGPWEVLGWYNAGDCVRLVGGEPPNYVDSTTISRVNAPECDRSAVGIQRGVQNLWIDHLITRIVGDQAIDFEPSNNGQIRGVTIRDSSIHTGRGHGIAVTLTGNDLPASNILIERVDLDGSILAMAVEDTTLRDIVIRTDGTDNVAPVAVSKAGNNFRIVDCTIERGTATNPGVAGPVVAFNAHAGSWPSAAKIVRGRLIQHSDGPVVRAEPASGLLVDGTDIECAGPTANTYNAIQFGKAGTDVQLGRSR